MMKRLALLAAAIASLPWMCSATQFGGFYGAAAQGNLKPFALDLGGLLGSDTFHTGRVLGFSGFDLGEHAAVQFSPDKADAVMRANGNHPIVLPWTQAEIGLPLKIDGFVRGTSFDGMTAVGGGLRYGLLKVTDRPWKPKLLAIVDGNEAGTQWFTANHVGASLVGSIGNQTFTPYLGIGVDRTSVSVTSAASVAAGTSARAVGSRLTAGLQYRPWTFLYTDAAYILLHGESGAEASLGLRF